MLIAVSACIKTVVGFGFFYSFVCFVVGFFFFFFTRKSVIHEVLY